MVCQQKVIVFKKFHPPSYFIFNSF